MKDPVGKIIPTKLRPVVDRGWEEGEWRKTAKHELMQIFWN